MIKLFISKFSHLYFIVYTLSFSFLFPQQEINWDKVTSTTGNRLAVLEFSSVGISDPIRALLTNQFRGTLKSLNIYDVIDKKLSDRVDILHPEQDLYGNCNSKQCIIDIGKMLNVNFIVTGTIIEKDDEYFIKGQLFSIDLEDEVKDFSLDNIGVVDSVRLEMKKMAYNVSGLPIPDTLQVEALNSLSNLPEREQEDMENVKWITFPEFPDKVKSLIYSTFIPGTGQIFSKKKFTGYGFMGAEIFIGSLALIASSSYQKSWGGFESTYQSYQTEEDPAVLLSLRPKIKQYARDTNKHNSFMRIIRNLGIGVWGMNMLHAYIVGPEDVFIGGDFDEPVEEIIEFGRSSNRSLWNVISGFGLRGSVIHPVYRGSTLNTYSPYTEAGLVVNTPLGFYIKSIFTSFRLEISNYSFIDSDSNQEISGTLYSSVANFDFSKKIKYGSKQIKKYIILGTTKYENGSGYTIGNDIAYRLKDFPLMFAGMLRLNFANFDKFGTASWLTLGLNIGLDVP